MAFLSGFAKRKAIKYGTVFPGSNLTDFPVLITIAADSDIASELSGGGGIAVTAADETTEIPFGLYPSSDPTSGDIIMRFLASPLTGASTGDVIAYIYFDSGETTVEDKAGVVANGFALFMPLDEDPSGSSPQMYDWVTETNLGTSNGSMTSGDLVAGQVGNGLDFDSNDYISVPDASALKPAGDFALQIWIKPTSVSGVQSLIQKDSTNTGYALGLNGSALFLFMLNSYVDTGSGDISSGSWQAAGFSRVGTAGKLWINGAVAASFSISASAITDTVALGLGAKITGNTEHFVGVLDEAIVHSNGRSADWFAYAYQNDSNNADTLTLGALETDGGGSVSVSPDVASITLTGIAPAASPSSAVSLVPDVGIVTLTAVAPIATATSAAPAVAGTASITISGEAPAASATGTVTLSPATASVTVSALDADARTTAIGSPDFASVTISGVAPSVSGTGSVTVTPDTASVTISAVDAAGLGAGTGSPDAAVITISAVSPTASGSGTASAVADTASITISTTSPSASGSGALQRTPDSVIVTLTAISPTVTPTGSASAAPLFASVTISAISPLASPASAVGVIPGTSSITITAVDVAVSSGAATATPDAASVTVSAVSPGIAGTGSGFATPLIAIVTLEVPTVSSSTDTFEVEAYSIGSDFHRRIYYTRLDPSSYNTDIGGVAQTTPAQIIRSFLIDVGVVTYPHRPVNGLFPCYAFSMPDNNDFAVCVIDVVGRLYGRGMRPNHNNIHPGVEILVRDRDETKGYLRMLRIAEALDFANAVTTTTPEDGMEHYITNIRRTTPVITLGEEIGKRRYRWTMNACVVFEKDSEPQLG